MPKMNVVLLPGLWRSNHYWHQFPEHLRRKLPSARVHCPDLPGFGEYCEGYSPSKINEILDLLRGSTWFKRLDRPFLLVGQSIGAMLALEWQSRYPDEVAGCILINVSDKAFPLPFKRFNWRAFFPLFYHWCLPSSALEREQVRLKFTSNMPKFRTSIIHQRTAWHLSFPPKLGNIWRQLIAIGSFHSEEINAVRPLLYINSIHDQWMSPDATDSMCERVPGKRMFHPTAGHDIALDEPAWLSQIVKVWLQSLPPEAATPIRSRL